MIRTNILSYVRPQTSTVLFQTLGHYFGLFHTQLKPLGQFFKPLPGRPPNSNENSQQQIHPSPVHKYSPTTYLPYISITLFSRSSALVTHLHSSLICTCRSFALVDKFATTKKTTRSVYL